MSRDPSAPSETEEARTPLSGAERERLLSDAEQFMRRAARRLHPARDALNARRDLEAANRLLQQGRAGDWSALRQALAADIAALAAVPLVDTEHLARSLGDLITRVHDLPFGPGRQLTSRKRQQVYRMLREQLERARYALLQQNPGLYRASLNTVATWVKDYFDPDAAETGSFRARLRELELAELDPDMPELSRSLALVGRLRSQARRESGRPD